MRTESLARTSDPNSSQLAAEGVVRNGQVAAHRQLVVELVRRHPGCTSRELASFEDSKLDRYEIARVLRGLATDGLIREGAIRPCRAGGRAALTWWPRPEQLKIFQGVEASVTI